MLERRVQKCSEISGRGLIDRENLYAGDLVATLAVTRRFDRTDAHSARLVPLLPAVRRSGRPSKRATRRLIDGILARDPDHRVVPAAGADESGGRRGALAGPCRRLLAGGVQAVSPVAACRVPGRSGPKALADAAGLLGRQGDCPDRVGAPERGRYRVR